MASVISYLLIAINLFFLINCFALPKLLKQASKRVVENSLSDEEHYGNEEQHNVDYDHEAFLGEKESKQFDDLTPDESKRRLAKMVDKIDADKDGVVSMQELKDWIQYTQKRYILEDSGRQWKSYNTDNQSTVTWSSYKKATFAYIDNLEEEDNGHYKEMMDRDFRRFQKADRDGDGALSQDEFVDFVHPEEADHMKDIVVIETMEDIDKDHDGKLSMEEFIGDIYNEDDSDDLVKEPDWVQTEREQFTNIRDADKSGFLEFDEVKHWILPNDYDNSEAEAKHLIYEADVNRDGVLSKEEILDKYDVFVGSQATDFGDALERHDEF